MTRIIIERQHHGSDVEASIFQMHTTHMTLLADKFYHIYNQSNNREKIFLDKEDYEFLEIELENGRSLILRF